MTSEVSTELTAAESKLLKECERTIEQTKGAFVACGNALTKIRDEKLYRKTHRTFESYCQDRWNMSKPRAYQLIEAAATVRSLPKKSSTTVDNERQARELSKVPKDKREKVLRDAERSGNTTAEGIKKAATSEAEQIAKKDDLGALVPQKVLVDWTRAEETGRRLLRSVSELRSELKRGFEEDDLIYHRVSKDVLHDLDNAYAQLKDIIPYVVCTTCQGHERSRCGLCKGRGFLSEFTYKSAVPEETRKIRERRSA